MKSSTIFAKSEIPSLVRLGKHENEILAGLCQALVEQVSHLLTRFGVAPQFAITGGITKNICVVRRIEERIGISAQICFEPQIAGALGAAFFAREVLLERRKAVSVD